MDLTALGATLHSLWTVWMVLVFLGICGYAMWPGNRASFDHASRIPLSDDGREG